MTMNLILMEPLSMVMIMKINVNEFDDNGYAINVDCNNDCVLTGSFNDNVTCGLVINEVVMSC